MIGFRVDANEHIATGHLMRCMSIAQQCMKQGEVCLFLLAEDKETLRLKEKNIPYRILNTRWNELDNEIELMKQVIQNEQLEWLVVDSYQATKHYLTELNQVTKVMYLDDMAQEIYPISAVLHYSQWPGETDYEDAYKTAGLEKSVDVLAGMKYTPLREEFSGNKEAIENHKKTRSKSILITTGGTDIYNVTGRLLKECIYKRKDEFAGYDFEVIVGNMNQYEPGLRQMAETESRIHLHKNVKNMSDYMRSCEMAVSAGGTTLFELCACKIPTVCFSFADNQQGFVEEMGKRCIMLCAGDAREVKNIEEIIADRLCEFMMNTQVYEDYAQRMSQLVDGQGSVRVAQYLCG